MDRLTITPTYSTQAERDHKAIVIGFGDGYEQRAADGINAKRLRYEIRYTKVTQAKATAVEAFLDDHGAVTPFIWTPPPPHDTPRAWIIRPPWKHSHEAFDCHTISVVVDEDKNPHTRCETPEIASDFGTGLMTITTGTAGAVIRYTTDGTDPTETTGTIYVAPFAYSGVTYKALAMRDDLLPSAIATAIPNEQIFDDSQTHVTDDGQTIVFNP